MPSAFPCLHSSDSRACCAGRPQLAAVLAHKGTGRTMRLLTNAPGLQLYTGNFLDGVRGKGGAVCAATPCHCSQGLVFVSFCTIPYAASAGLTVYTLLFCSLLSCPYIPHTWLTTGKGRSSL